MISKVLLEKRKSLLEMNKNSQELFLTKGYINILNFVDYDTLINFVQDKNAIELRISAESTVEKTLSILRCCQTSLELKDKIEELKLDYDTSKIDAENGNQHQRDTIISTIGKNIINEFKNLAKYHKASLDEFYDSGKWCYYLCFGILETAIGTVLSNDKIVIRAPLLCLPLGLKRISETNYIIYKRDKDFVANEILSIYLKDKLNVKYFDQVNNESNLNVVQSLENIVNKIPSCIFDKDSYIVKEQKKTGYKPLDNPVINNNVFVAFINPVGGKMLEDYDEIIGSDYQFPQENLMFSNQGLEEEIYKADNVFEVGRLLNVNQKKAVVSSLKTNTLIYGPPGTGKSEVVTSIIANNIANNFNVLISSEKKAALDVISDRLDALKDITITIDQENEDKFYDRIISLNDEIINANKVDISSAKPEYIQLVNYLGSLVEATKDPIKSVALNKIIQKGSQQNQVKDNSLTYASMLNKIQTNRLEIADFVNRLYAFDEPATLINKYFEINSKVVHLFNKDGAIRFINVFNEQKNDAKRLSVLNNFIEKNVAKAKLFPKAPTESESIFMAEMVKAIEIVSTSNPITFFINYQDWLPIIRSHTRDELTKELEIYSIQTEKSFAAIFDNINTGKILYSYLNEYWSKSMSSAKITARLIRDKYLYDLKNKFISSANLQQQWIEMVKKAHLPTKINIAKFIKEYYSVLKFVFPIWILSPDNVANYIPLKNHEFALGVFDEASQMRVERSIPLIYRCTRSVVSGDDKQLRPSKFFAANIQIDADQLTSSEELDNVESLLDKAKIANWSNFTLSNHYRSYCEELINFSNKYIYDGKLLCITKNGCNDLKPVEVIQMPQSTVYDRSTNTNPDEAKKVVEYILKCSGQYKKIVIITFNQKQADLIENLCYQSPVLTARIEQDTLRIRSIENVQGDEADLVVISTTFGTDADGKFIQNFGPVGQAGGKNRINVMVTRAKEKMCVIKSFMSDQITSMNNDNLYILKMFLFYIENLQNNNNVIQASNVTQMVSPISETIAASLFSVLPNKQIKTNYMIGSHGFNVAIINNEKKIQLLLLIDSIQDLKNNGSVNDWVDSFDHQRYYMDRGYQVLRFNEIEWIFAKNQILEKIKYLCR